MAEEVIWQLEIDGSGAISSIDEIMASLDELQQMIAAVVAASTDLASVDEGFSSLSASVADATTAADGMAEALASMSQQASEDTTLISSLNETIINLEAQLAVLRTDATDASEGLDSLGGSADKASEGLDGGKYMGAAMMLQQVAQQALQTGKAFMDMGMQGQNGEALVKGMAGASQQDIQALQQEALKLGENMQEASQGFYQVASAGYDAAHGGLTVFENAVKASKASQSQLGDVSSAITSILHAYNLTADDSGKITDELVQTTVQGKQSFSDLASAIGPLAATGHAVGISFAEVTAAEATMTQINPHVKQDSVELQHLMNALAQDVDKTAKTAHSLGLTFDEAHYKSLDLMGKLEYLRQQTGHNDTAFTKLVGGTSGLAAALDLLSGKGQSYATNLKAIQASQGATDKAFETSEQTISAHLDKIGAGFSVLATKVMDAIGPKIIPLIDKVSEGIGKFTDFVMQHIDLVMPVLASLAAMFGTTMVIAIGAMLAPIAGVIASLSGWIIGIGAVAAGAVLLVQHWDQVTGAIKNFVPPSVFDAFLNAMRGVWTFLVSTFQPVWQQLQDVFNTQIKPAVAQLIATFNQVKPELTVIAQVVGVTLVVAFGLLVGAIGGFIKGLAGVISGLAVAFGGVVQMITGIVQTVSGIVAFIVDLVTGHFDKLGGDLKVILGGIGNIFSGFGNVVKGIFEGLVKGVTGTVSGMADGIMGYFTNIVHGVGNATQQAKDKALQNSLQMKDQQLKNAEQTDVQTVQKYEHMRLGIIDQLSKTKDAAARHHLQMQLDAVTKSEHQAVAVYQKHVQMRTHVESELDKLKKGASDKFGSIQKDIQNIVGNVTKWLKDTWDKTVKAIADAFKWMYDHNYIFHDLVDSIKKNIEDAKKFLEDAWNKVKQTATDAWNWLKKGAEDAWKAISQPFKDAWSTYIRPALTSLWKSVSDTWSGYVTQATQFGANVVKAIADGITSRASDVKKSASGIADDIKKFLGFHSPTEEGPGSTAHLWAPALLDMFIDGLEAGKGQLKATVAGLAEQLASLNMGVTANITAATSGVGAPPSALAASQITAPSGSFGSVMATQHTALLQQILGVLQQINMKAIAGSNTNVSMNNTINAPNVGNAQQMYNLLQSLGGYGYESLIRSGTGL